jgi:hypothetical protein
MAASPTTPGTPLSDTRDRFFAIMPTQKAGTLGAFATRTLGSAMMAPVSLNYRFHKEKAYPSPLPLDASVFLVKTTADPGSAQ